MFKLHFNRIQAIFFIVFGIFLFINLVYSSNLFQTPRTCRDTWGSSCSVSTLDDALDPCNGTQTSANEYVKEVYINASYFFFNDAINVTCEFQETDTDPGEKEQKYIYYYNGLNWIQIWSNISDSGGGTINQTAVFQLNATEGTHWVRCIILLSDYSPDLDTTEYCANSSTVDGDACMHAEDYTSRALVCRRLYFTCTCLAQKS